MSIGYEFAKAHDEHLDRLRRKVERLRTDLDACRRLASERWEALEEAERKAGKWKREYEIAVKHLEAHKRLLTRLELSGDELHYDASDFAVYSRDLTNSLALWDAIRSKRGGRRARGDVAQARQANERTGEEMTELRKGQRVWVEATIDGPADDDDGLIPVWVGSGPQYAASVSPADIRPTYLARREAMVRAIIANEELSDSLAQGAMRQGDSAKMGIVGGADEMLRAIYETPVPEWAGGENE